MGDTILASVVIGRQAELSIGSLSSNELASSLLSGGTSPQCRDAWVSIDFSSVLVLGLDDHAELVKVNGSSRKRIGVVGVRVGSNTLDGGHGGQSGNES